MGEERRLATLLVFVQALERTATDDILDLFDGLIPSQEEVNPAAYTLCVLDRLHQALRRRGVFVATSERYGDPRAELLRGEAWDAARETVARALDRSLDPAVELARLQAALRAAYAEVRENLPHNTALQVLAAV